MEKENNGAQAPVKCPKCHGLGETVRRVNDGNGNFDEMPEQCPQCGGTGTLQQAVEQILPKCQYCGEDPAPLIPSPIAMGGAQAVVFHCGNPTCRAIFSVQLVAMDTPRRSSLVI